jgi:hypothetical protein
MKLPNGDRANLGNKIEDYCLNLDHNVGKHKAILFKNRLGLTLKNSDILKNSIKHAALTESVILRKVNEYGQHYNMKFLLRTEVGESLILIASTIRFDEDFPRLTNCYPVNK